MVRQTSIEAYRKIKENGYLSAARWRVYDHLYGGPGNETVNEMFRRTSRVSFRVQANFHARLNELVELGYVRELPKKTCGVSGGHVLAFDVTDLSEHRKYKRKETKAEKEREACARIAEDVASRSDDIFSKATALKIAEIIRER